MIEGCNGIQTHHDRGRAGIKVLRVKGAPPRFWTKALQIQWLSIMIKAQCKLTEVSPFGGKYWCRQNLWRPSWCMLEYVRPGAWLLTSRMDMRSKDIERQACCWTCCWKYNTNVTSYTLRAWQYHVTLWCLSMTSTSPDTSCTISTGQYWKGLTIWRGGAARTGQWGGENVVDSCQWVLYFSFRQKLRLKLGFRSTNVTAMWTIKATKKAVPDRWLVKKHLYYSHLIPCTGLHPIWRQRPSCPTHRIHVSLWNSLCRCKILANDVLGTSEYNLHAI